MCNIRSVTRNRVEQHHEEAITKRKVTGEEEARRASRTGVADGLAGRSGRPDGHRGRRGPASPTIGGDGSERTGVADGGTRVGDGGADRLKPTPYSRPSS